MRIKYYLCILLMSVIIYIPMARSDYNIFMDDGIQHIARLIGTYNSITSNENFTTIMIDSVNGFGYSWNIFYSPISAYIPLIFKIFNFSFVNCFKLFSLLVTFLTGISMFEMTKRITKNNYIALISALIYIFAPYRLTDMYIRMAIAELTSFIFLPLVFLGLYNIFNMEDKKEDNKETKELIKDSKIKNIKKYISYPLIIGTSGLILSHTVITFFVAIYAAVFCLINIKKLKNMYILKTICLSLILILLITSFFIAPMLEHYLATQYEVFVDGRMERNDILDFSKLSIINLLYTYEFCYVFEIGLLTVIGTVLSIITLKKVDGKYKQIYKFSLIAGIISIICSLKIFPFEYMPSVIQMLQFPFRMLEFSAFFLSFVVAINIAVLVKLIGRKEVAIVAVILTAISVPYAFRNTNYNNYIDLKQAELTGIVPVTVNTGRVHAGCATFEYFPVKAYANMEYIIHREDRAIILEGNAQINNETKEGLNMSFDVSEIEEGTIIELPYIYYLGYSVNIYDDNEKSKLKITESDNGFIQVQINEKVEGTIEISYTGTIIMKASRVVSLITFTVLILFYVDFFEKIWYYIKERKNH